MTLFIKLKYRVKRVHVMALLLIAFCHSVYANKVYVEFINSDYPDSGSYDPQWLSPKTFNSSTQAVSYIKSLGYYSSLLKQTSHSGPSTLYTVNPSDVHFQGKFKKNFFIPSANSAVDSAAIVQGCVFPPSSYYRICAKIVQSTPWVYNKDRGLYESTFGVSYIQEGFTWGPYPTQVAKQVIFDCNPPAADKIPYSNTGEYYDIQYQAGKEHGICSLQAYDDSGAAPLSVVIEDKKMNNLLAQQVRIPLI